MPKLEAGHRQPSSPSAETRPPRYTSLESAKAATRRKTSTDERRRALELRATTEPRLGFPAASQTEQQSMAAQRLKAFEAGDLDISLASPEEFATAGRTLDAEHLQMLQKAYGKPASPRETPPLPLSKEEALAKAMQTSTGKELKALETAIRQQYGRTPAQLEKQGWQQVPVPSKNGFWNRIKGGLSGLVGGPKNPELAKQMEEWQQLKEALDVVTNGYMTNMAEVMRKSRKEPTINRGARTQSFSERMGPGSI